METLFSPEYNWVWATILALALYLPVRRLIWTLQVRRAQRRTQIDEAEIQRLRRRAGITSALLCLVFGYFYASFVLSN